MDGHFPPSWILLLSCTPDSLIALLNWRLKHQWDRSRFALKWCDGYECVLEVIVCSFHLYNAVKAGSCVSVVCSYSLHTLVKWMVFLICSMVVDDVHFLCFFLFSSWFAFAFAFALFDVNEWVRMKMRMNKQVELQFSSSSFSEGEKCGFL